MGIDGDEPEELLDRNPPISDKELKAYKKDPTVLRCTSEEFRVDFEHPWGSSDFNKAANKVFIDSFLDVYNSGSYRKVKLPSALLERKVIAAALHTHMEHQFRLYRNVKNRDSDEDDYAVKKRKAANTRRTTVRCESLLNFNRH